MMERPRRIPSRWTNVLLATALAVLIATPLRAGHEDGATHAELAGLESLLLAATAVDGLDPGTCEVRASEVTAAANYLLRQSPIRVLNFWHVFALSDEANKRHDALVREAAKTPSAALEEARAGAERELERVVSQPSLLISVTPEEASQGGCIATVNVALKAPLEGTITINGRPWRGLVPLWRADDRARGPAPDIEAEVIARIEALLERLIADWRAAQP